MISLLVAVVAGAGPSTQLVLEPSRSSLRYHLVHKLHEVDARATRMEGKVVVSPEGRVQAMVRAPVASFDSGDGNRDANMREAVDAANHPFAIVKGVAAIEPDAFRQRRPVSFTVRLAGEVELRGVRRPLEVPLSVTLEDGGTARVKGTFTVSLEGHKVERPSLLFVKVEDDCRITLDLVLREVKP
jgi:polyisoprenoid-binding protein YceI